MNNPAIDESPETRDGETAEKKLYVKPAIDESAEMPTVGAVNGFSVG